MYKGKDKACMKGWQQEHVQVKWKVKVKHMFLKRSKEKHANNSLEMKRVPQAHVKEKS